MSQEDGVEGMCLGQRAAPVAFALLVALLGAPGHVASAMKVTIYTSLSCPPCKVYVDALVPALREAGFTDITLKDWSVDTAVIAELQNLHEEMAVPRSMRGKVTTVVDGRFLFEGFVPAENIALFLKEEAGNYKRFVLYMAPGEDKYRIMNGLGQVIECPVTEPLRSCDAERFKLIPPGEAMLPLVIGAGLLNGFNPCASKQPL
ncbi:MAG: hypothetical protein QW057_08420 [Candidatus Bathyarchaeia archaeon]